MVESTALEMRHTRKGIEGSNPSLSAIITTYASVLQMQSASYHFVSPHFTPQNDVVLRRGPSCRFDSNNCGMDFRVGLHPGHQLGHEHSP